MVINKLKKSAVVLLTAAAAFSFSVMPLPANAADIMTTGQVPSGITAAAVDYNTVKVTWNAAAGASAYNVYRAKGNGSYTLKSTTSGTSYTADHLATGSTYHFIITTGKLISSSSSAQTQSLNSVSSVTEVSAKPKLAQTSVSASAKSYQKIKVSWTAVAGANKYKVYRKKGSGSFKKIKTTSAKSYTSKGLKSSTTYTYKVKAVRSTSTYSYAKSGANTASAKTKSFDADGRILSTAKSKRGCKYVWGAQGPGSFDCSGYVYWVYKNASATTKTFGRKTAQGYYSSMKQYSVGSSLSNASKGDILLIGSSRSSIVHAAIYYGSHTMIHASSSAGKVTVSPTSYYHIVAILHLPRK